MKLHHHKMLLLGGTAFLAGSLLFNSGVAQAKHHKAKPAQQQTQETNSVQRIIDLYNEDQQKEQAQEAQANIERIRAEAQGLQTKNNEKKDVRQIEPTIAGRKTTDNAEKKSASKQTEAMHNVRLTWQEVPGAVSYQVVLLHSENDVPTNIARTINQVFTNGVDIDLSSFGSSASTLYWKVAPLDYTGKAIGSFSTPAPITEGTTINPQAPLPTTQFDQMDYSPVYPVYSWIPMNGAKQHQVQVWRVDGNNDQYMHTLSAGEYDVYEDTPFNLAGKYFWRVRSVDSAGNPTSEWSERSYFTVTGSAPIAALGDSITHGGGVMSVPPGYLMYDWETYSSVPVKNIGVSGNTTQEMIDRFERDVLPFAPKVLIIMGGVNDYRAGTNGWTVTRHLKALKEKCDAYGIIPVFLTVTPINPTLMTHRAGIEQPPFDWLVHQRYINDWIMKQTYHIDVSSALANTNGWLRNDYTTDGLHPDYFGKRYIGEQVGKYLQEKFGWITQNLTKKPIPEYLLQNK